MKTASKTEKLDQFGWSFIRSSRFWWSIAATGLVVVLTLVLSHFVFVQSYSQRHGLRLERQNAHDTLWHLALMESINRSIMQWSLPPENPVFAGEQLRGYHYLNDLIWVGVHRLTTISLVQLYLVVAPIALAGLFVISSLLLFRRISSSKIEIVCGTVLLTIGSGLAAIASTLFPNALIQQSLFWLDQPTHYGFNQQLLLALSVVNTVLWELRGKKRWWVLAFLIASLAAIKVYAVLILLPALLLGYGWWWVRGQERSVLGGWFLGGLGAAVFLLLNKGETGWPFIVYPGYFFRTMFEAGDRLNASVWELQRQVFAADHNYLRLVIHWAYAATVFYLGNFGVKVLGIVLAVVVAIKTIWLQQKMSWSPFVITLVAMVIGSCLAPALLIQKGVVWNTIQFMHFAQAPLVVLLILAWQKLGLKSFWQQTVLVLLTVLALPTTMMSVSQMRFSSEFVTFSNKDLAFLAQLSGEQFADKQILVSASLRSTALVPAFAGRSVYLTDPIIVQILGLDATERYQQVMHSEKVFCPLGFVLVDKVDGGKNSGLSAEASLVITDCDEINQASDSGQLRDSNE